MIPKRWKQQFQLTWFTNKNEQNINLHVKISFSQSDAYIMNISLDINRSILTSSECGYDALVRDFVYWLILLYQVVLVVGFNLGIGYDNQGNVNCFCRRDMISNQKRNDRVWYQYSKHRRIKTRATLSLLDKMNVSDRMGRKSQSFFLAFSNFRNCYLRMSNRLLNGLRTHIRNVKLKHL